MLIYFFYSHRLGASGGVCDCRTDRDHFLYLCVIMVYEGTVYEPFVCLHVISLQIRVGLVWNVTYYKYLFHLLYYYSNDERIMLKRSMQKLQSSLQLQCYRTFRRKLTPFTFIMQSLKNISFTLDTEIVTVRVPHWLLYCDQM